MHPLDWIILIGTLLSIAAYGVWHSRNNQDMKTYLTGSHELRWWTIGLSIMATQASAITFLSTTGLGYKSGMGFAQFYIGLPIAMVLLSIFFLPVFYRLKVYTAYEYLETRFDLKTRMFTAFLFLLSRGMAAGFTIYAPGIVLSAIFGWDLNIVLVALGAFVILYTAFGGSDAVSVTQQQQMTVILVGMVVAAIVMVFQLPKEMSLGDAVTVAGKLGKTKTIDFTFDLNNRYNFWSGMLGGTFLFLSYFGTDQSQVQRYLSGKTLTESRLGLLFNGMIKVPMQMLVLFVGVLMFIFYQFTQSPIHFNNENLTKLENSAYKPQLDSLQKDYNQLFQEKKQAVTQLVIADKSHDAKAIATAQNQVLTLQKGEDKIRDGVKTLIKKADPKAETNDKDYVFITFIIHHMPIGVVGLLLAVIFSAAMSSKSSELNALATSSVIDFYKRSFRPNETDKHYMLVSKLMTGLWGILALAFALTAQLFENLIEAVNIVGSLFYGPILGIFVVAFFIKHVRANAVFAAAILSELLVIAIYLHNGRGLHFDFSQSLLPIAGTPNPNYAYLWLNPIGCFLVMGLSLLFQSLISPAQIPKVQNESV
jgi:solute:Na+ symporter, SSS family